MFLWLIITLKYCTRSAYCFVIAGTDMVLNLFSGFFTFLLLLQCRLSVHDISFYIGAFTCFPSSLVSIVYMTSLKLSEKDGFTVFLELFWRHQAVFVAVGNWCIRHYALMQYDLLLWTENLMVTVQKSDYFPLLLSSWSCQ